MDRFPSLTTPRLVLRVPVPADADRVAAFHRESRAHLARWEPRRAEAYFTTPYWREELARVEAQVLAEQLVPFILLARDSPDGPVLGNCTLSNLVRGPFQAAHLGFALAGPAVGQGFMFEALSEVVRFAFTELRLHRLMANYQPENVRSADLLRRLGFTIEGLAHDYLLLDGEWRDHVLTSLVNPAWREA